MNPEDIEPLRALPELQTLRILGAHQLRPLPDLAALGALESLDLGRSRISLDDLRRAPRGLRSLGLSGVDDELLEGGALARFDALESLDLSRCEYLDLKVLAPLTGLKRLSLERCSEVHDLRPLAKLEQLESLDLRGTGASDLTPLSRLSRLRDLRLDGKQIVDYAPLQGLAGLTEGVALDAEGRITRADRPLRGVDLGIFLEGNRPPEGVRSLDLSGAAGLTHLGNLEGLPALERVDLTDCAAIQDASPLGTLPALRRLEMRRCLALTPRPKFVTLDGPEAIDGYRRTLRSALRRDADRAPERERWLQAIEALRSPPAPPSAAPSAATARRRGADAAAIRAIRRLICAEALDDAAQGFALMMALEDPAVIQAFSEGVSLDSRGRLQLTASAARRGHLRPLSRRGWAALYALRAAGALDGATKLKIGRKLAMPGLAPLRGLTALRSLHVEDARAITDLSPLAGMVELRRLELDGAWELTDLAPLATLTGLRHLSLQDATALRDLSPLKSLPSLQYLDLRRCYGLHANLRFLHRGRDRVAFTVA